MTQTAGQGAGGGSILNWKDRFGICGRLKKAENGETSVGDVELSKKSGYNEKI